MVNETDLGRLTKENLILYNKLLEKDIRDVAYRACIEHQNNEILKHSNDDKIMTILNLNEQLSRFIGWNTKF